MYTHFKCLAVISCCKTIKCNQFITLTLHDIFERHSNNNNLTINVK